MGRRTRRVERQAREARQAPEARRAENAGSVARSGAEHRRAEEGGPAERSSSAADLIPGFSPENELERRIASDPELLEGLRWGRPRASHPEGAVGRHVADLLGTIEDWGEDGERRELLRLLALVHDSFKYQVDQRRPKTGENHHAARARRFAERYTDDRRLLGALELHDRPYALWRRLDRTGELQERELEAMIDRLADPGLFLRFVELDGSSSGKSREPIRWFRAELERRGVPIDD